MTDYGALRKRDDGSVRYKAGKSAENRLLAFALWAAWDNICYWCREPKEFDDIEVDHIVPRARLAAVRESLDLASNFDIDGLGNLAPICGSCNSKHKNADTYTRNITLSWLKKADRKATEVRRTYRSIIVGNELTEALTRVAQAPMTADVSEMLEALGPAVASRLAMERPDLTSRFTTTVVLDVPFPVDAPIEVPIELDAGARDDVALVDRLWDCDFMDLLPDLLVEVLDQIEVEVAKLINSEAGDEMPGPPTRDNVRVDLAELSMTLHSTERGPQVEVVIGGSYSADHSASWFGSDDFGDPTDKTIYSTSEAGFSFSVSAGWGDPLELEIVEVDVSSETFKE